MIKDFYIRYGAANCTLIFNFIKLGQDSIKLYRKNYKYIIVKKRSIVFESFDFHKVVSQFRYMIELELPEEDLFNS